MSILSTADPGPADLLVAQAASKMALLMLGSRFSLRNAPWLINLGQDLVGKFEGLAGGGTLKIPLVGLDGLDEMSSVAENASISETAVDTAAVTVSPADFGLKRAPTDKTRRRDPTGTYSPQRLAIDGVMAAGMTLTTLIAQEVDGGTQVGSTGVDFSHDTFLAGQFALKQGLVPGPYCWMLKPKSFTDWQADLERRGGVTQWRPATAEMQALRGEGYEGNYNGMDVLTSDKVQGLNSNADWGNACWGRGAVGYIEEPQAPAVRSQHILLDVAGPGGVVIRVAEARDEDGRVTEIITHYSVGTVLIETARLRTALGAQ